MSSHNFNQELYTLHKKFVCLCADITFGVSGAPTLVAGRNKGIKSISRTSAGLFVITLDDVYVRFLSLDQTYKLAAGSFPAAPNLQVTAETVATTKTITVQFSGATSSSVTTLVAADPANGEEVMIEIHLSDSGAF